MYEDVLIATDGSDVAADAATTGISIAETLDAAVRVLSVVESGRDNPARRDRCEAAAESIATRARDAGCDADTLVRSGRPASEILAAADEADTDLIVVGTYGRTGLKQVLLGSVALEVIRDAHRPVLSVGPDVDWDEERAIDDILLATDGWTGSVAATDEALSLAEAVDADLHTLYAVDVNPESPKLQESIEEHGEQTTRAVADRAAERGVEATQTIDYGPPSEIILEYAADKPIDLLVMGTESKSNLERLVVGSVSQRVVPNATVPVMTVRTIDE